MGVDDHPGDHTPGGVGHGSTARLAVRRSSGMAVRTGAEGRSPTGLRDLQRTLAEGRAPTTGLADGALLVLGAALLVTPGFVTDAMGLACVLPVTRALLRRVLVRRLAARARVDLGGSSNPFVTGFGAYGPQPGAQPPHRPRDRSRDDGVVEGVVVDAHDEPEPPPRGSSG